MRKGGSDMKKYIALALCLLLFLSACKKKPHTLEEVRSAGLSPAVTTSVTVADVTPPEGYTAVAKNDNYALFADMKTGDFAVWDFAGKRFIYSGRKEAMDQESPIFEKNFGKVRTELISMLSIEFVQISTIASTAVPFSQNSYAYCVMKNHVKVETIENGYRATFTFADIEADIPVEITLQNTGVTARVVGAGITSGEDYQITSIDLLPGFMAGYEENDGYLFVPSGCGALVPLDSGRGESAVYREMVYGNDLSIAVEEKQTETKQISVPVYGYKENDHAIFAVITKGDGSAEIAVAASSPRTCFTRIYSGYVTAAIDSTTLFESNFENQRIIYGVEERGTYGDYEVQYSFLSGEQATWAAMAGLYRKTLSLKQNAKSPRLMLTLYGAGQRDATFMGVPYQKDFAMTSFADAKEILSDLDDADIPVSLRYVGWNDAGVQNKKVPISYSPSGVLGGKGGLKKLTGSLDSFDADAYFDINLLTFRESGRGFSALSDVCKSIFNTRTPIYQFIRSTYVPSIKQNPSYLLAPGSAITAVKEFLKSAGKLDGLSLGDLGTVLYSDFSNDHSRESCLVAFRELLSDAAQDHPLAFENANAYAYPYADRICSLPMTSDGNILFSTDVPFLQVLLHGSVSYAAENGSDLLDCIAYGADPQLVAIAEDDSELMETSFNWLYGTTYRNHAADTKEVFRKYNSVYKDLYKAAIVDYRREGDISRTVFDTGDTVLVNHGSIGRSVDGVFINAGEYQVVKGADAS